MQTSTPKVQYAYAAGSANTIRLEKITYPAPGNRELNYSYGDSGGNDDQLSRVASLLDSNGTSHLVDYQYMGAAAFAIVEYPLPGLKLTYANDASTAYTGWGGFGRIVDQRWLKSGIAVEELQYGYDRASNRLYRKNVVAASGHDELCTYDGLNQLKKLQRGTLNTDHNAIGTQVWEEDFTFDPTGNWNNYTTSGSATLNENRTHNKVNAITAIASPSVQPSYAAAGNMTTTPQPGSWSSAYTLTWDAWNRLIKVQDGSTAIANYAYDGLTRRTTSTDGSTNVRHYYYSQDWQILEGRTGTSTTAERQFVWGQQHLDDLVLRDRIVSGTTERRYSLSDPLNVTAIAAESGGTIQERYEYTAFGTPSVLQPDFSPATGNPHQWESRFGALQMGPQHATLPGAAQVSARGTRQVD